VKAMTDNDNNCKLMFNSYFY